MIHYTCLLDPQKTKKFVYITDDIIISELFKEIRHR